MIHLKATLLTSVFLAALGSLPAQAMSGMYTVGATGANFTTIGAAAAALAKNGVNGPVEIVVNTGKYTESFSISPIAGASSTNTVTFRATVPTVAVLRPKLYAVSGDLMTIQSNVHYLTIDGFSFESVSNAAAINMLYNSAVGNSDFIIIKNCVFNVGVVPPTNYGAIRTQTVKNWRLNACEFHLKGTALYSQGSWDMVISRNTFDNQGSRYCLSLWNSNKYRCLVYNNVFTGSVSGECVRIDLSHYGTDFFHNTFNLNMTAASSWVIDNSACCGVWNRYFNNIFVVTGLGGGIRHRYQKDIELNNNIYFIKSGVIGNYNNVNYSTLATWGTALGTYAKNGNADGKSIVGDPKFFPTSSWQLLPSSPAFNAAVPTPATWTLGFQVQKDYLQYERGSKKDIGAHELAGVKKYGAGCPGTGAITPKLVASGNVAPGDQVNLDLTKGKGSSPVATVIGSAQTSINVGGTCELLTNFVLFFLGTTSATGTFQLPAAIPNNFSVIGVSAYAQMGVGDNAAGGIGVAFTNGLELKM